MAGKSPLEAEEQKAVVEYLEKRGMKFTAIPNSTYTKSWKQKRKNKEQGLRPGLPDLLVIAKNKLLFIEMKRVKGSATSNEQVEWVAELNKIENVEAKICYGAIEAINFIDLNNN